MNSADLPIFDRVIAQYPFLSTVQDAKLFCRTLCRLSAVKGVTPMEYYYAVGVANGEEWGETASNCTVPRPSGSKSPITAARLAAGMTQAQLAASVGCAQKDISRWENGSRNPKTDSLQKIAQVLGCTMEDLIQ